MLRIYIAEDEVKCATPPPDALRAELVQSIAMVNLLLQHWYEPSSPSDLHLSTLVQQLLSLIAQHGGVLAADAFSALVRRQALRPGGSGPVRRAVHNLGAIDVLGQPKMGR